MASTDLDSQLTLGMWSDKSLEFEQIEDGYTMCLGWLCV